MDYLNVPVAGNGKIITHIISNFSIRDYLYLLGKYEFKTPDYNGYCRNHLNSHTPHTPYHDRFDIFFK